MAETPAEDSHVKVFISYSHKDEPWKDRLATHLEVLRQQGLLDTWDDRKIRAGAEWYNEIQEAMAQTPVAVCLISADYLASGFVIKEEIPYLLKRREEEGMVIIPVLLRPCCWEAVKWLAAIQMFPRDGETVAVDFEGQEDVVFADVAREVHTALDNPGYRPIKATPVWTPPEKVYIGRLPSTDAKLFGRKRELQLLDEMWNSDTANVVSFVAWGGVGKSTLVNQWLEYMKADNYRGARRVYGWSFYSQGTGQRVTSADQFVSQALEWFGDSDPTQGSAWDKGARLAALVRQEKTLLILDGMEPLQVGEDFEKGKIKDPALSELVKHLARQNNGLCVITTREKVAELERFETGVMQVDLEQISKEAGRVLLRVGGVQGTDGELEAASAAFGNHALAVSLLATYLHGIDGHHVSNAADIPDLPDVSEKGGKHPRRVIEAFATRFGKSPQTQVLHIMGLFDRPPEMALIDAVKAPPPIAGLTDELMDLDNGQWHDVLDELRACRLLAPKSTHNQAVLDCHPLIREHFAKKLRKDQLAAWQAAHWRLYVYFRSLPAEELPQTMDDMEPLLRAVTHACHSGEYSEAFQEYLTRICQGRDQPYSFRQRFGAYASNLSLMACFFEDPKWNKLTARLDAADAATVLSATGMSLLALGRVKEAEVPLQQAFALVADRRHEESLASASRYAIELSKYCVGLGHLDQAEEYASRAVKSASRVGNTFMHEAARAMRAHVLHQKGLFQESLKQFQEAEEMQRGREPESLWMYRVRGYYFCELLLTLGRSQDVQERAAWVIEKKIGDHPLPAALHQVCWCSADSRAEPGTLEKLDGAVATLRGSGAMDLLPIGLLARARLRSVRDDRSGARTDLDEAWDIAERGSMRLFMADLHLYRARLFSDKDELAQARDLIEECGYGRRKGELEDAEKQIKV